MLKTRQHELELIIVWTTRGQQLTSGMSTILLSFWSLQFQSRTTYLKACRLRPSVEWSDTEQAAEQQQPHRNGSDTLIPFSMRALIRPGVPTPMWATPFRSSFTCSSICRKKDSSTTCRRQNDPLHLNYLDVLSEQFHSFGLPLERRHLPVDRIQRTALTETFGDISPTADPLTYLSSSMARSAELQTMRITTEPVSECCFWIFAHLGQTLKSRNKRS